MKKLSRKGEFFAWDRETKDGKRRQPAINRCPGSAISRKGGKAGRSRFSIEADSLRAGIGSAFCDPFLML